MDSYSACLRDILSNYLGVSNETLDIICTSYDQIITERSVSIASSALMYYLAINGLLKLIAHLRQNVYKKYRGILQLTQNRQTNLNGLWIKLNAMKTPLENCRYVTQQASVEQLKERMSNSSDKLPRLEPVDLVEAYQARLIQLYQHHSSSNISQNTVDDLAKYGQNFQKLTLFGCDLVYDADVMALSLFGREHELFGIPIGISADLKHNSQQILRSTGAIPFMLIANHVQPEQLLNQSICPLLIQKDRIGEQLIQSGTLSDWPRLRFDTHHVPKMFKLAPGSLLSDNAPKTDLIFDQITSSITITANASSVLRMILNSIKAIENGASSYNIKAQKVTLVISDSISSNIKQLLLNISWIQVVDASEFNFDQSALANNKSQIQKTINLAKQLIAREQAVSCKNLQYEICSTDNKWSGRFGLMSHFLYETIGRDLIKPSCTVLRKMGTIVKKLLLPAKFKKVQQNITNTNKSIFELDSNDITDIITETKKIIKVVQNAVNQMNTNKEWILLFDHESDNSTSNLSTITQIMPGLIGYPMAWQGPLRIMAIPPIQNTDQFQIGIGESLCISLLNELAPQENDA